MEPTTQTNGRARRRSAKPPLPAAPLHETSEESSADLKNLLRALQAMRVGDFTVRMAGDQIGIAGKIADTFNEIIAANQRMS